MISGAFTLEGMPRSPAKHETDKGWHQRMKDMVLAVDIGGTNTKLSLVNPQGETGEILSFPTTDEKGLEFYLSEVTSRGRALLAEAGRAAVAGLGIGVAGFIDPDHSQMTFNPNIGWLEGVPLKEYFRQALELPVCLEIDSNAAALAEAVHGAGKDSQRLLVVSVGTGVGGGMIVDGEILRIANECLGDIGHVIVEPGGRQCAVGCRGCAEAMASAPALEAYAAELMAGDQSGAITTPEIIRAAQQGDGGAGRAIQKLGGYLGIALASIVPILAPDQVCIAGGVSEAGQIFFDAIQTRFLEVAGPAYSQGVKIQKSAFGWQSVLVGAAAAQRRESNLR